MFALNIQSITGSNMQQEQFAGSALLKFGTAMNTDLLKQKIINFTCSFGQRLEDNLGLTNKQVYDKLMAGSEIYNPVPNTTADLFLVLQQKNKPWFVSNPAIGFGLPGTKQITT